MTAKAKHLKPWAPLEPGDIIDIVAPAFAAKPKDFANALKFVEQWGFTPRVPNQLLRKDLLFSASDEFRLETLSNALLAEDSKAVWCLRGGYGSIRLLPGLKKLKRPRKTKLFIGLSDITSLHLFLNQEWQWSTVHGPMVDRLGKRTMPESTVREVKNLVMGRLPEIEFKNLKPLNDAARTRKVIRAPIAGGNLITLQSSLGTPFSWNTHGKILFFEDIGERAYRVDRVFVQFEQAGLLKGVKAIVLGDFTGSKDPDGVDRVPPILKRIAESLAIPMLKGIRSGHAIVQRPVPFGPIAELKLGAQAKLIVPSGARFE